MSNSTADIADSGIDPSSKGSPHPAIVFLCSAIILVGVTVSYHKLERNYGHNWKAHAAYWTIGIILIGVMSPMTSIAPYLFSGLTVTVIGVAMPIYESIRAVCSPEEDDDKAWLQYWMVGGVLFMATTWVDDILGDTGDVYWDETMCFLFFWLYFPKTDGAVLIYEHFTKPYIAPRVRPIATQMHSCVAYVYKTMVNAAHLWVVWIIFLFLPRGLKRVISVCIGTVYPLVCSIGAASTEDVEDDTYWLTYWAVYGCLFLLMDILETWIGWIPGFYTLIIFSTVYLMLPMFEGADKVFRRVLVPLAGLDEMLMLRDAISIKKSMFKNLDPERAKTVRKAIAKFYNDDDGDADPVALKKELVSSWKGIRLPHVKNPFSSTTTTESAPTENTSLV